MPAATSITPGQLLNEYARHRSVVEQFLTRVRTAYLARVIAVSQNGSVEGVGTVDVQPLVGQLDGTGTVIPHGVIHSIPYMRMQGGANAVILDPQPNDIGLVVVCDRDNSSVRSNMAPAAPGSLRKHDMSDSVYAMTVLSTAPKQYIVFSPNGINVVSPTKITFSAPDIEVDASSSFTVNSPTSTFSGAVTIEGLLTWLAGMAGSAASGVAATITGIVNLLGQFSVNGKRVDDTHTHTSEQPGTPTSPPL